MTFEKMSIGNNFRVSLHQSGRSNSIIGVNVIIETIKTFKGMFWIKHKAFMLNFFVVVNIAGCVR